VTFARLHALARRQRRRAALLVVMLSLAGAVVVAHGALGDGHMGDGTMMCLAMMAAGGLALLVLTRDRAELQRALRTRVAPACAPSSVAAPRPAPRRRGGPALLQVFLW
jgi:hypothetical protein